MREETKHEKGLAFLVHKDTVNSVMECRPMSSRLITIRLAAKPRNIAIIQPYASISSSSEEDIEQFYCELQSTIKESSKKDVLIV